MKLLLLLAIPILALAQAPQPAGGGGGIPTNGSNGQALTSNGSGAFGTPFTLGALAGLNAPAVSQVFANFLGCSGTMVPGYDGNCHTLSGGGYLALTSGAGSPSGSCSAFSSTNLAVYMDTSTGGYLWFCNSSSAWQKWLSTSNTGQYTVTGATGAAVATPSSGLACYFDSTSNTQICIDTSGLASTTVRGTTFTAHAFMTYVDASGVQHSQAIGTSDLPAVPSAVPTSGPVADPGGPNSYEWNGATGALTFSLPAGVAGYQRCYRNATGKTGAITVAVTTANAIDLNGANGTTGTGTLVSGGALGDAVCLVSDTANHWYAYVQKGTWTNN